MVYGARKNHVITVNSKYRNDDSRKGEFHRIRLILIIFKNRKGLLSVDVLLFW